VLSVQHASVHYATSGGDLVHALDDVSLDIGEGEIVVALGASGCGKSTLLNAIAGFLPLSAGTITIDGAAVTGPGADRGVVFQKDTLLPWATVEDNVAFGLKLKGWGRKRRRERARELLALVGLAGFAGAAPYELSGGMRQRVSIARSLATEPAILLMDEPFGALDSLTRESMQELLVRVWQASGCRILFITHSIEEALFLGTAVVVMSPRPGRIVSRYALDYVRRFAATGEARAVKADRRFAELGLEVRDLIHRVGDLH
jgi:taurine transport system ATP-binding protein